VAREAKAPAVIRSGLRVLPESEHRVENLARDAAVLAGLGIDTEQFEIAGEAAGADAPVETTTRHLIELRDALREHQRIVIRQARHAGRQLHALRALERPRDEQIGARNVFPLRGEVLADPGFLVAEPVQQCQLLQIVVHRFRRIGARRVQRHREIPQSHRDPPP